MKYQQVRDAIDRIENARMDLDAGTKSLRALGVTDLPGDAPTSPAPVLPWRPSWEMIAKARSILTTRVLCDESIEAALSAAAAVAPKPAPIAGRVAEPTPEPVRFAFDDDAPKPAPGNLPVEPTEEMVEAGRCRDGDGDAYGAGMVREILRAALAAAPRVEVPEITEEDCQAVYVRCQELQKVGTMNTHEPYCDIARLVRARLIARMGAQS